MRFFTTNPITRHTHFRLKVHLFKLFPLDARPGESEAERKNEVFLFQSTYRATLLHGNYEKFINAPYQCEK